MIELLIMGWTIDFDLSIVLLAILIWIGITLFFKLRKRKGFVYLLFFTVFYIYLVEIIDLTQFPIYLNDSMRENIGQNVLTNTNFVPLIHISLDQMNTSLLNILMTIPFGFGLPFITNFNFKKVVLFGCLTSFTLETLQFFSGLSAGFTFRFVDINDIIFNTIGTIIGYVLFTGFIKLLRFTLDKWEIEKNAILEYIYQRPQISDK